MSFSVGRKTTIGASAAVLAIGFSSLAVIAAPAYAAETCVQGTYVSNDICELKFLSGTGTFTPDESMSQLQALIVGGGGSSDYGYAGGGGSVAVVNFADTTTDIDYSVGEHGEDSFTTQDTATHIALSGGDGSTGTGHGGNSGSNTGYILNGSHLVGAGAGAGGNGAQYDGGEGISPGFVSTSAMPFTFDFTLYGGGGASSDSAAEGAATAGGGYVSYVSGVQTKYPATPNTGGGAGGGDALAGGTGASGIVVFRWLQLAPVTFTGSFDLGGHGDAINSQIVADGDVITQPTDPTATGFTFNGWFTDVDLQNGADFASPISADTTYYAKWTADAPTFTGSFSLGGHGDAINQQVVSSGNLLTKPADPTAEGYTFGGWYSDAELAIPADFDAPITADTTLYAAWAAVPVTIPTAPTAQTAPTLPITGAEISPLLVQLGIAVVVLGGALIFWSARRARLRRK